MKETVILTTLSTLPGRKTYSYYYLEEDGKRAYCDGLLSVEAGTKYYLSSFPVDRIVVIASKETRTRITEDRELDTDARLYAGRSLARVTRSNPNATDAELFFDRISFFWNGIEKKDLTEEIDSVRKQELLNIVRAVLRAKGERCSRSEWFDLISRKAYYKDIEKAVRADIEDSFLSEADYRRYSDDAWAEAERDFQEKLDRRATVEDFFRWLDQNGKRLSWLAKEAFCRLYQERLNQWLSDADLHTAEAANAMREQAIQYREAIRRLTEEMNTLKTNRRQRELAFLQRKLFLDLSPEMKLSRLDDSSAKLPSITVVPDEDIYEIVRHIRGQGGKDILLLVDVQGGNRTSSYEMNSLLSILKNTEKIDCRFSAVNFSGRNYTNKIQNETQRYNVADLVAAMNAFVSYGRAKQFQRFCATNISENEPELNRFLNYMTKLEDGLVLCNVTEIKDNLKNIKAFFSERRAAGIEFSNPYLRTLQDNIEQDYACILVDHDGEIDLRSLIDWAMKKSFIQQAITLAEALIPGVIVRSGILFYAGSSEQTRKAKEAFSRKYQEAEESERWKFKDVNYYFIKHYCTRPVVQAAFERTTRQNSNGRNTPRNDPAILLTALDRTNNSTFQQINSMMDRYRDICNLRNMIAHAAGGSVSDGTVKNCIKEFWKAFDRCRQWVGNNPPVICLLTLNDIRNRQQQGGRR